MENNRVTAVDIEAAVGDVYRPTVEAMKPSRSYTWTIVGVVVLVSLCAVASTCFAWHFTNKHEGETMELRGTASTDPSGPHIMLTQIAKSTKAAIHLHVATQQRENVNQKENKLLHWVSGVDQSFTKGGLKLKNNAIVIPHDGLYFVYSQVSYGMFCKSNEEEQDGDSTPLSYSIQWSSLTAPSASKRYLLNGVKSVCQSKTEEQNESRVYDSIYLGAVFQLYKGDKLSTESNHFADIDDHSAKTFFGVFEL